MTVIKKMSQPMISDSSTNKNKKRRLEINQDSDDDEKQKETVKSLSPPPKTKLPNLVVDLPPSLTTTYTYDVDAFSYHRGQSTAGIFSSGGTFRFLRPYPPLNLPLPSLFTIPSPFSILSSSSGLLLVRSSSSSSSSTYHILNPFLVSSPSSHLQLPPPPQPHPPSTPAVLSVDTRDADKPIFHVICLVEGPDIGGRRMYTSSTFSSNRGCWSTSDDAILFDHRRILANTGVSNGCGMAFWLTDSPPAVVRLTITADDKDIVDVIDIPHAWIDTTSSSLQLGRLSETSVGLIAASAVDVVVHRLEISKRWFVHGFLNVVRWEGEAGEVRGEMAVVCPGGQDRPGLMRFEREVGLWIGGRMVILVTDWESTSTGIERVHEMPEWTRRPESVEDAVPYVCMDMSPRDFPVTGMEIDDRRQLMRA